MDHDTSIESVFDELAKIEPDRESVQRAIVRARERVSAQSSLLDRGKGSRAVRFPQLATAAGLLLAVSLAAWFALGGSNRTVAFAEVQQQLESIRTVQYIATQSHIPREGKKLGPTSVVRHQVLGRYRERREILAVTPGEELGKGSRWNAPIEGHVTISNLQTGKIMSLTPEKKHYGYITAFVAISPDDGSLQKSEPKPMPEADIYQQLRSVPIDKAERLSERNIDGKKVVGFRTVEDVKLRDGTDTWTRTYWVDSQTKLPVRIEHEYRSTVPNHGWVRSVQSDFVFDAPLDEALFSTDPPAGYTDARNAPRNANGE